MRNKKTNKSVSTFWASTVVWKTNKKTVKSYASDRERAQDLRKIARDHGSEIDSFLLQNWKNGERKTAFTMTVEQALNLG